MSEQGCASATIFILLEPRTHLSARPIKTASLSKTTELLNTSMKAKATTSNVQAFSFQVFEKMGKLVNDTYKVLKN